MRRGAPTTGATRRGALAGHHASGKGDALAAARLGGNNQRKRKGHAGRGREKRKVIQAKPRTGEKDSRGAANRVGVRSPWQKNPRR